MKIRLIKSGLKKSYKNGLVKVAVTVNGKHGQYQSHRWKSAKTATKMLKDKLKEEGIDFDSVKFRDKKTKEEFSIDELTIQYEQAKPNETYIEWVRDNYEVPQSKKTAEKKVDNQRDREQAISNMPESVRRFRAKIPTTDEIIRDLKSLKGELTKSKDSEFQMKHNIAKAMKVMGVKAEGIAILGSHEVNGAHGYCRFDNEQGTLRYSEIAVEYKTERSINYAVKTILHEATHLLSNGIELKSYEENGRVFKEERIPMDETITELIAASLTNKIIPKTDILHSYSKEIVEIVPKLLQLDEYKHCKTLNELGEVLLEKRLTGQEKNPTDFYRELKKIEAPLEFYTQYHQHIKDNIETIMDKVIKKNPKNKGIRTYIEKEALSALKPIENSKSIQQETDSLANDKLIAYGEVLNQAIIDLGILNPYNFSEDELKDYREKAHKLIESLMEGKEELIKRAEKKLSGATGKQGRRTKQGNTETLDQATEVVNKAIDSRGDTKTKAQLKLDMERFYQMLKNGSITLSQAINNPEFSSCAYLLIQALEDEDLEDDINLVLT